MALTLRGVIVLPFCGELSRARFYQGADVLVLPGVMEGEPSVLSEGMACGLPPVASAISGHLRLVEPGVAGRRVLPN